MSGEDPEATILESLEHPAGKWGGTRPRGSPLVLALLRISAQKGGEAFFSSLIMFQDKREN